MSLGSAADVRRDRDQIGITLRQPRFATAKFIAFSKLISGFRFLSLFFLNSVQDSDSFDNDCQNQRHKLFDATHPGIGQPLQEKTHPRLKDLPLPLGHLRFRNCRSNVVRTVSIAGQKKSSTLSTAKSDQNTVERRSREIFSPPRGLLQKLLNSTCCIRSQDAFVSMSR